MTRFQEAISLGLILGVIHGLVQPAKSVPVVPNFTQAHDHHTETTSKQTETINSIDYATGWQYTVSGTNVSNNGAALLPPTTTNNVTVTPLGGIEGQVTSSAVGLDFSNSNFTITNPGAVSVHNHISGSRNYKSNCNSKNNRGNKLTDTTSIFTNSSTYYCFTC